MSRKLLDKLIEKDVEIYISEEILEEYTKVLKRDFDLSNEEIGEKLEIILSFCRIINPQNKIFVIKEDPTDNKILECAIESNSEFIVSYDNHLLGLKEFKRIKIIEPEEFLYILEKC